MSISAEQAAKLLEGMTKGPRKDESAAWYAEWHGPERDTCDILIVGSEITVSESVSKRDATLLLAAPDLARALIASEAARKLAEERLAKAAVALKSCAASLERVDLSEGVCCCGDDMKTHSEPMSCGHSPLDMGEYYARLALSSAHAILKEIDNG